MTSALYFLNHEKNKKEFLQSVWKKKKTDPKKTLENWNH